MKSKLLSLSLALMTFSAVSAQVDENGYTTVELTTGVSYANRVFFDLSANNIVSQDAYNWDVAFWRTSAFAFGTRINDAQNIEVYEASNNPADWDTIDIADIADWGDPLYNPDQTTDLAEGAFEQGSASYGWGEYNGGTHHIDGTVIFVLKYLDDNSYIKFIIEDYYGGYTFKYSKWDGTSWGADVTKTIANGTSNRYFNYFSFDTDDVVENNEPEIGAWDLVFTRYFTFFNNIMMYPMAGVLQAPGVTVARVQPETQDTATFTEPLENDYSAVISTIGHSWKGMMPGPAISDVVYYIKKDDELYRLYFLTNGGQSTGNMYFKYKPLGNASTVNFENNSSFTIYPNPTVDKQVTLIYDITENASNGEVAVYNISGQKLYTSQIVNNSGFYQQNLNLSDLSSGVYIVKVQIGNYSANQKLIIK